jgi:hypothetical protein
MSDLFIYRVTQGNNTEYFSEYDRGLYQTFESALDLAQRLLKEIGYAGKKPRHQEFPACDDIVEYWYWKIDEERLDVTIYKVRVQP